MALRLMVLASREEERRLLRRSVGFEGEDGEEGAPGEGDFAGNKE